MSVIDVMLPDDVGKTVGDQLYKLLEISVLFLQLRNKGYL